MNPEQSNEFGPSAPQKYGHPILEYAKFKTACTDDVLDAGGLYELLLFCAGFLAGFWACPLLLFVELLELDEFDELVEDWVLLLWVLEVWVSLTTTGSSGGKMVTVTINGKFEMIDIHLDPICVDNRDVKMLEDLIVAAQHDAASNMQQLVKAKTSSLVSGMNIPGLNL